MVNGKLGCFGNPSLDIEMMTRALDLAEQASQVGEVPVGALVTIEGRIVSQAYNLRETLADPTAHAERLALTLAGRALGSWHLESCTIYVTLEPCCMCAGAINLSRISRLVYAASDPKAGACRSLFRMLDDRRLNHRISQTSGVLAEESRKLLSSFFQKQRSV
ncbi:nucleoside deaminase [Tundrisphaera lichenicola]|uniref:nucleoside deaminase n=1 Tax=Tundrisphaera lichenicola TaxID=2029860 RepID=UPI003EBDE95B